MKQLLNDLRKMIGKTAAAVKDAAHRTWHSAIALLRRLRQTTADTVATAQTAVTNWWQAARTPLTVFVVVYVLMALFAVSSMMYGFYVERTIPEVQNWLDALFSGRLRLPGWELTAARIVAPQTVTATLADGSSAG